MAQAVRPQQPSQVPRQAAAGAPMLCAILHGSLPKPLANPVYDWWSRHLVDGQPPSRSDFDILNFAHDVRHISLSLYDREKDDYRFRVFGTVVVDVTERELTGRYFLESLRPNAVEPARAYFALLRERSIAGFHIGHSPHGDRPWQLMSSVHTPIRSGNTVGFIHYSRVLGSNLFETIAKDINARLTASGPPTVIVSAFGK